MPEERLQKFLASAGVASRRKAEEFITAGRVCVNGAIVKTLGAKIDPDTDEVTVDGMPVLRPIDKTYLLLNKPAGYVTTAGDELGRPTVMDLVGGFAGRLFPVGRLDMNTEGLLIVTDDGDFAHLLMHPRHMIWKTYVATVRGRISDESLDSLRRGIALEDGPTAPAEVELVRRRDRSVVRIAIREGRKRQVRRMFSAVGHQVEELERVAYGPLVLGDLERGSWRELAPTEIDELINQAKR